MRFTRIKMIAGTLAIAVVMALGTPNLALGQRGGGHGGGGGGGHGGGPGGGGGGVSGGPRGGGFQTGRTSLYANPQGFSGGNPGPGRGDAGVQPSGRGGQYDGRSGRGGQFYGGSVNGPGAQFYGGRGGQYGGRGGQYYGGSQNWNGGGYPNGNRYSSGYRGNFYGNPGIRIGIGGIGIGSAFGPYGYGAFPWYSGGAFYGGGLGYGAAYRGYGNTYGYNNYGGNGTTYYRQSVPVETQQAPQQLPPEQDYVPQLNNTTAQLATAASGRAALGVTLDPQYPSAAVVREVIPGSPAEQAGLRPGDMITSLDERQVQSYDDVVNLIGSMQPGATVAIQFVRPILRSEVQAAAPEQQTQQLSTPSQEQLPSTTGAIPPAAPTPPTPAPLLSQ